MSRVKKDAPLMDKLISLTKRRGFIFQSSEIYGGLNSIWDYGPLGVELKRNIQDFWWREMTQLHENIVGLDSSILMHPRIWEASGHLENFHDPMVDCKKCKARFRADDLENARCPQNPKKSPLEAGCELTEPKQFNLMFKTFMGPTEETASVVYLRPETAQGIYVNYINVLNSSRLKVPFGIAQVGKAFRNEITTSNFIFRTREFEQMEMQFFVNPATDEAWFEYWKEERHTFYRNMGINMDKLRFHPHGDKDLAHYAKAAFDIEYEFPFGWKELEGIHNRTDFDLKRHQEFSRKDLTYFDDQSRERFLPFIIETSAGLTRMLLMVLCDAYREDVQAGESREFLTLHPKLAPITVGVFPLQKKDGLPEIGQQIVNQLKPFHKVSYDQQGQIGRRYRRMDEIGTPFCVTIDYETKENNSVTVRERDSLRQERVSVDNLNNYISDKIINYKPL